MSIGYELRLPDLSRLRSVLNKCVAECPTGVLVDLAGAKEMGGLAASALASAAHRAMRDFGVPVLLYGADERAARQLSSFSMFASLYDSHDNALLALRSWVPRWIHARVPPIPTSVSQVRHLISDTCLAWGLGSMRDAARLVASELTTNAVEYAITDMHVTAAFNGRYLRIAVQDGSPTLPRLISLGHADAADLPSERGRGLHIVSAVVTSWGVTPVPDGKIVWALLRANPSADASAADPDGHQGRT